MSLWMEAIARGEPWEREGWAVDELGKRHRSRAPYERVTSNDVVHRSSTGCGQNISSADFPGRGRTEKVAG